MGVNSRASKASLLFIFVTIAIDSIGLGIVIPVLPDVMRRFLTDDAQVSRWFGYFVAVYALMQFLSSPLLGSLADRFGRRPILLVSLLGAAIDYVFMAFAPTLPLLFLGRIISGVSGASYTVASAYIADISTDQNRSKNFGVIGAGFGLGFIVGPAIGGFLASYGSHIPFLAAGCFNLLGFLFGLLVLPESLPAENRRAVNLRALNPLRSFGHVLGLPSVRLLIFAYVLIQLAGQTHPSVWTLYTEHRYGWTPAQVGLSLAVVGIMSALSQGGLTGFAVKKLGERRVVIIGCFGEAVSFILFGLASTGTMLYLTLIFGSVFWAMHPALQSLLSREVPANEQGELQGSLMGLTSLMAIINPILMTTVFAYSTQKNGAVHLPGAPYFLGGALFFVAWVLAVNFHRSLK